MNLIDKNELSEILIADNMNLSVTGMRPQKLGGFQNNSIHENVKCALRTVLEAEWSFIITGGAQGVDLWSAEIALDLGHDVVVAVPFAGQEKMWPKTVQDNYFKTLERAKYVTYVSAPGFSARKMQIRNQWMVNHTNAIIGVWNGTPGGTQNCIEYAKTRSFIETSDFNFETLSESNKQIKIINPIV